MLATTDGRLRGRWISDDIHVVLGVPYAAAPFGDNRFRPPRPAPRWSGVRDATSFGPIAPQSAELPGAPVWRPRDEDVLTLNVWSPRPAGRALPVLFWIHGGAYTFGSSAQPDYDAAALAASGLVVVTSNHRLGFEGFGHVPGLPDNRGLLDQVAALRWVRDNIAVFGGDPDNVTIAGQSSGAGSVVCLMAMGQARGLFRRAIAHSVPDAFFSVEHAARITERIARAAGVAPTVAGLTRATPNALVSASDQVVREYRADRDSGRLHYDPVLYGPVVDGDVLPADPLTALAAGVARDVDLLVCHALEEAWLMHEVGGLAEVRSEEDLARFAVDLGIPPHVVRAYHAARPSASVLDRYLALVGDAKFGEFSSRLAERHGRAGGRAHLSRFARRRTGRDGVVRAWHCADVPFVFGNLDAVGAEFLLGGPPDDRDRALSRRMSRAWAGFAATGDPGWPALAERDSPVRIWSTVDDLVDEAGNAGRMPWRDVPFPLSLRTT
ncbi:carboxylesterase/lipase family protein [Streptoalloteichus tenebrarius]|uniref:carboxylesterase/lipase family protein n=1 Tax=Streptoalloteichus tenebrarius (strain ATCC 17920 / DSM 40477 / JCM 4838 / CBS 697.72 / NBRC 16177 / NCIMB 11028 / NRRL B-12390 / A12253. 1 / ISP 5477) TaxID=1933 RepID=UPI0020A38DDF|nr:carboxylesterase family protein [Streptoalloteichus tenebrarius]